MIALRDIITFAIGLLVGVASGASAMWAVAKPLINAARHERDNARLEARAARLEFHSN